MSDSDFHSQHGEDRWIVENLPLPTQGRFCEVGAYDGVKSSNTYYFEKALGWTGDLIEPDPMLAWECIQNRSARTWCCAAGLETTGIFYLNMEDRGMSGFLSAGKPIHVLIRRLDWLLFFQHVDLLSIDTEGTELDVWQSIGTLRPKIVIIEYLTLGTPPRDGEIVERFTRDGYREVHRTPCNLIFTR